MSVLSTFSLPDKHLKYFCWQDVTLSSFKSWKTDPTIKKFVCNYCRLLTLFTKVSLIPALLVLVVVSLSLTGSWGGGRLLAAVTGGGRSRMEASAGLSFLLAVEDFFSPDFLLFFLFSTQKGNINHLRVNIKTEHH